jgi:hypothetical protein
MSHQQPAAESTSTERQVPPQTSMAAADFVQMMKGYSEVQKTYTQYAVGSLVLPLTFLRDLLGIPKEAAVGPYVNYWLWLGWVGLLACIGASLAYQTVASRRIAEYLGGAPFQKSYPRFWFNLATGGFFVGLVCLFIGVVHAKAPPKAPGSSPQAVASAPK